MKNQYPNTGETAETRQNCHEEHASNTLADIDSRTVLINSRLMAKKVEETFEDEPELTGVIIIDEDDDQLLGMISRRRFMEMYSKPFRKELHNKKPLKLLVKYDFDSPLCLQETDDIDHAVRIALSRPPEQIYEPIVVNTINGGYKLIDMQVLLLELARVYERQSVDLRNTLSRVKQLEGIIAICSYCKKIRNDANSWDQLETYISSHSEALFSHGVCPECFKQQMDEINRRKTGVS
ncbi:MAG: hypothetical protein WCP20_00410 [Desulfuromonadales bacterium]